MSMKVIKRRKSKNNFDPSSVDSNSYNDVSGARKVIPVGHFLKPIKLGTNNYTTDASTRRLVGKGQIIAIYANGAAGVITVGNGAVTSGAAGTIQAGTSFVRIPCKQDDWTYINTYDNEYIITNAATTLCFIVEDDTFIEERRQ